VIEFQLDSRSRVSPYRQLVHQVRQALPPGPLGRGGQRPTVKEIVGHLAINPNTVLKAYRELERDGRVGARPGWFAPARRAGLDDESIEALVRASFRSTSSEGVA
jgi:GntR family transcriptional regulator